MLGALPGTDPSGVVGPSLAALRPPLRLCAGTHRIPSASVQEIAAHGQGRHSTSCPHRRQSR